MSIICFLTFLAVYFSDSYKSIYSSGSVTSRIQLLISFVFAGYISIVIGRWTRVRNDTIGQLWGALEDLNLITFRIVLCSNMPADDQAMDTVTRYGRLMMRLLFQAAQSNGDLSPLHTAELLTTEERSWLEPAQTGTRPLVVVSWLLCFFEALQRQGYHINDQDMQLITAKVMQVRGGVGATLALVNTQLPYPYVHVLYWTIQLLLTVLAVETGVILATSIYFRENGLFWLLFM